MLQFLTDTSMLSYFRAWLEDEDDAVVHALSRRIALITGLQTESRPTFSSAEPLQVDGRGICHV